MPDIDTINKSTPEELRQFAKDIDKYCLDTKDLLISFLQNHRRIGEHWSGEQYDQFTTRFIEIQKSIAKKLDDLQQLKNYILTKAQALEEAQKITL